jgi:hypothetical protein
LVKFPFQKVDGKGREGNERERWQEVSGKQGKKDAYLTHGCGFADGKIFRFRSGEGILFLSFPKSPYCLGGFLLLCFLLWRRSVAVC